MKLVVPILIAIAIFFIFLSENGISTVSNAVGTSESQWRLSDNIDALPIYHGITPKKADIIISTRTKRDDSIETIKKFGATRVEWVFTGDKSFVNDIKKYASWFGGTINANVKLPSDKGVAKDFDGKALEAPWMRGWGAKWITTTHPDTQKTLFELADKYIFLGADSIQFDDPLLQLNSTNWGGDFSTQTISGFRQYLIDYPDKSEITRLGVIDPSRFNYREYLETKYNIRSNSEYLAQRKRLPIAKLWESYIRTTVQSFFINLKKHMDTTKGSNIPLSMNLGGIDSPDELLPQFFLANIADYVISETPIKDFTSLEVTAKTLRAIGTGYVPSILPTSSISKNRWAIASLYAMGATPLIPWDTYIGSDKSGKPSRYYGKYSDYGDLFNFIKKNPNLFNGWEDGAVVGIIIPVNEYSKSNTLQLIKRLHHFNVPYSFILSGGTINRFLPDTARLNRFKKIIKVNPDSDFFDSGLMTIKNTTTPVVNDESITDTELSSFSPVSVRDPSDSETKVIARIAVNKDNKNQLLLHVIRGQNEFITQDSCKPIRINIEKIALPAQFIKTAVWYSLNNEVQQVKWVVTKDRVQIDISSCSPWGIIAINH